MEPIYRTQFTISIHDCDRFGRLKPSSLVAMMQQVSSNQCLQLNLGWEDLAKKNLFWAHMMPSWERQKEIKTSQEWEQLSTPSFLCKIIGFWHILATPDPISCATVVSRA